jgi:hypothetical protein
MLELGRFWAKKSNISVKNRINNLKIGFEIGLEQPQTGGFRSYDYILYVVD